MGAMVERRTWVAVSAGLLSTAAVTILFRATSLDVDLQSLAYDPSTTGWPHAQRQPWKALHDFRTIPGLLLALGAIAVVAMSFVRPQCLRWRVPALYIVTLTALDVLPRSKRDAARDAATLRRFR